MQAISAKEAKYSFGKLVDLARTSPVVMPTDALDDVHRTLAGLRATPVLWIGSEAFESLTVFGFYKEFGIDRAYPTVSCCSLTIEGLT